MKPKFKVGDMIAETEELGDVKVIGLYCGATYDDNGNLTTLYKDDYFYMCKSLDTGQSFPLSKDELERYNLLET